MRARRGWARRALVVAGSCAALTATAAPFGGVAAQVAPDLPEARAHRALATGGATFAGTIRPALLVGGLYQISLTPVRSVREEGILVRRLPSWYLHLSASAGWSFAREPDDGPVAAGAVGVVRRPDHWPVSAIGPVATAMVGPGAWGAALRVELADNIGVQAGWQRRTRNDQDVLVLSVDLMRCLLSDLELGPCLGPR